MFSLIFNAAKGGDPDPRSIRSLSKKYCKKFTYFGFCIGFEGLMNSYLRSIVI